MIEYLRFLPLDQALTIAESIPLIHLSKEFSTAYYVLVDKVINFEVNSRKTSITKARFCKMLGFGMPDGLVDPNSISLVDLIHMFNQLAYNELEAQEKEAMDAKVTLKTHESLFPPWTMERILNEVVNNPILHWFKPMVSFELVNSVDSQFDFPVTPRSFLFRCFEQIEKAPLSDYHVNHKFFSFYINYEKPQLQIWSLQMMVAIKVYAPFSVDGLINVKFKGYKGSIRTEFDFTLANLPCMNPND
ncbi:unnamed protein product [Lactuca saligna]|uniref:Uncharacterized protein n=1 Tax=Lactuca saligna TaxID=75948 RepID=A0AA35Y9L0_LACSI|nr:unnamed protein product [Lactuca saligna]